MICCPICNSQNYDIEPGYGSYCEDCGFGRDAEGTEVGVGDDDDYCNDCCDKQKKTIGNFLKKILKIFIACLTLLI